MRVIARLVFASVVPILGCQESDFPPPPIGGATSSVVPPLGGNGPSGQDGDSGSTLAGTDALGSSTRGSSDTLGSDTLGTGSTTAGTDALVTGRLLDGPAQTTPVTCYVRLHLLDALDPGSGLPLESVYEEPVNIRGLPQAFAITSVTGDVVSTGDSVYVSTICDVDGDGVPDSVGAYYPAVPVLPVDLPATGIDMALDVVF